MTKPSLLLAMTVGLCACAPGPEADTSARLQDQVYRTERAFADTMARRDHSAFATFLDAQAVFLSRGGVLHGPKEVQEAWAPYFQGEQAPFSWEPDAVEILDGGRLAFSTGKVRDPSGRIISRFDSIWRRNVSGEWKIIFDKGSPAEEGE